MKKIITVLVALVTFGCASVFAYDIDCLDILEANGTKIYCLNANGNKYEYMYGAPFDDQEIRDTESNWTKNEQAYDVTYSWYADLPETDDEVAQDLLVSEPCYIMEYHPEEDGCTVVVLYFYTEDHFWKKITVRIWD